MRTRRVALIGWALGLGCAYACFQVVPMEGKGFGVVATRPLQPGELLYEERPLVEWSAEDAMQAQLATLIAAALSLGSALMLVAFNAALWAPLPLAAAAALFWRRPTSFPVPSELQEQWDQLTVEQQEQLKGLTDCSGEKSLMGILRTNGFSRGASASSSSLLVCPVLARLNHSCSPNCQQSWDEAAGAEKLYAMTKIQPGEELSITYCDLREPREARQEVLQAKYGFLCGCPACSRPDVAASDRRRLEAARLQAALPSAEPSEGVAMAQRVLRLLAEEGIEDLTLRGLACTEALQHAKRLGDMQQARSWAEQAYTCFSQARGPRSEIALSAKEYLEKTSPA